MRHPWMSGLGRAEPVAPAVPAAAPQQPADGFKKPMQFRPSLGGRTATSSVVPTVASYSPQAPTPTAVQPSADVRISYAAQPQQQQNQPQVAEQGSLFRPRLQPRANTSSAVPTLKNFVAGAGEGFNDARDGTIEGEQAKRAVQVAGPVPALFSGAPPPVTFQQYQQQEMQTATFASERPALQPRSHTMTNGPTYAAMDLTPPVKRASGSIRAGDAGPIGLVGVQGANGNRMALDFIMTGEGQQRYGAPHGGQGQFVPHGGQGRPMMPPTGPAVLFQPNMPGPKSGVPLHLQPPRPQLQPRSISSGAVPTLRSFLAKASAAALDADMDTNSQTDSDSEAGMTEDGNGLPRIAMGAPPNPLRRSNTTQATSKDYFSSNSASREDSGYGASNGNLHENYPAQPPPTINVQQHPPRTNSGGSEADDMEF